MKDYIKDWLKDHGKDRQWLADQLGLTKSTINNWLSTSLEIPESKHAVVRRIFEVEEAEEKARLQQIQPQSQIFSVEVTLNEFRQISQAAKEAHQTIEEWNKDVLCEASEEYAIEKSQQKNIRTNTEK